MYNLVGFYSSVIMMIHGTIHIKSVKEYFRIELEFLLIFCDNIR